MFHCQVPHKVTPLYSGTGMIIPRNIWGMFINLVLKISSKGLIPLVSIIILLSSFKILSVGLAFSRKESYLLPSFCKDLLLILECNCALSNVVLCHKANGSMRLYLLIKIFFLSGQKIGESLNRNKIWHCILNISGYHCWEICFPRRGI